MNIAFLYHCNKCCKWSVVPAGKDVDNCWSCKTPFVEPPISVASNIVWQDMLNGGSDLIEAVKEEIQRKRRGLVNDTTHTRDGQKEV